MKTEPTRGPWTASIGWKGSDAGIYANDGKTYIARVYQNRSGTGDANARLIAASRDLLACQTMGASKNTPDFLEWLADRLVNVYGESPNVDFVLSLRERAAAGRTAMRRVEAETI